MIQTENNAYDKLLYYLSHEGDLRWEKFKDSIDSLTGDHRELNPSICLKSLGRLGHLEYDPIELSHVAIAPAVLIDTAVENRYVLVGSRTPAFLKETKKCVSDTRGKWHTKMNKHAPRTICLSDLTDASLAKIENLGIHISTAFSAKLSKLLPIPNRSSFEPSKEPIPDSCRKFNHLKTLKYNKQNNLQQKTYGLYEIEQYGPAVYILKYGSDQRKVPRDWGEWLTLSTAGRKTGFIYYEKETQRWYVKRPLQLPLIIDRCATLCSGFPPKFLNNNDFYYYSDVPIGVAYQLTKSLHQKWEIIDA